MASVYVETAKLIVRDEATANVKRINTALRQLRTEAQKLNQSFRTANQLSLVRAIKQAERLKNNLQAANRALINISRKRGPDLLRSVNQARQMERSLQKALQLARQAAATANTPIRPRGAPTGGPPGTPGATGRGGTNRVAGIFNEAGRVLRISAMYNVAFQITNATFRAVREGATAADTAENAALELGLTQPQQDLVGQLAAQLTQETPSVQSAEFRGLLAETVKILQRSTGAPTNDELRQSQAFLRVISPLIQDQIRQGASAEDAIAGTIDLVKVIEQAARATDSEGDFSVEGVTEMVNLLRQVSIQLGREFTPQLARALFKSLRTAKFTLDDGGIFAAFLQAEEQGSTAGVGINQLLKQLTGERVRKSAIEASQAIGLIQTDTGRLRPEDEALLRRNPAEFVQQVLIPTLREHSSELGITFEEASEKFLRGLSEAEVRSEGSIEASQAAGILTTDRTATESLVSFMVRANEILAAIEVGRSRDPAANQDLRNQESLLLNVVRVQQQFTSAVGEIVHSMESVLNPALETTAQFFAKVARVFSGAGTGGDTRDVVAAGALGTGGIIAAIVGFRKLFGASTRLFDGATKRFDNAVSRIVNATRRRGTGQQGDAGGDGGDGRRRRGPSAGGIAGILGAIGLGGLVSNDAFAKSQTAEGRAEIEGVITNAAEGAGDAVKDIIGTMVVAINAAVREATGFDKLAADERERDRRFRENDPRTIIARAEAEQVQRGEEIQRLNAIIGKMEEMQDRGRNFQEIVAVRDELQERFDAFIRAQEISAEMNAAAAEEVSNSQQQFNEAFGQELRNGSMTIKQFLEQGATQGGMSISDQLLRGLSDGGRLLRNQIQEGIANGFAAARIPRLGREAPVERGNTGPVTTVT